MDYLNKLLDIPPFDFDESKRGDIFYKAMLSAVDYHIKNCKIFKKWCLALNIKSSKDLNSIEDIPFFPNMIFKKINLLSTQSDYRTILSSGTSGQEKSKIYLDNENSRRQRIVLAKILNKILGNKRLPFLISDVDPFKSNSNNEINARVAGMTGYLLGSSSKEYVLKSGNKNEIILNIEKLEKLVNSYNNQDIPVVIIGYTFMIYEKIISYMKENKIRLKLPKNSFLIHFGGWKKLEDKKIDKIKLTKSINKFLGIKIDNIVDIYGFTEQLGTIYPSFGLNNNKVPAYSQILIRDMKTLKVLPYGKKGFIHFLSPLPTSYPGISILNDDVGRITKKINGKVEFEILKRIDNFEQRGCGDTLPENYYI